METQTHKLLDLIEHIWPYITGLFVTMLAGIKLWWHNHKETKSRIKNLEIMAEHLVTREELHECRNDVRQVDEANLAKIQDEIKELTKDNAKQHQDIMKQIIRLHGDK